MITGKNKHGGIIVSSPGPISNYYWTAIESNIKYTRNYKGEKYDQNGANNLLCLTGRLAALLLLKIPNVR